MDFPRAIVLITVIIALYSCSESNHRSALATKKLELESQVAIEKEKTKQLELAASAASRN